MAKRKYHAYQPKELREIEEVITYETPKLVFCGCGENVIL